MYTKRGSITMHTYNKVTVSTEAHPFGNIVRVCGTCYHKHNNENMHYVPNGKSCFFFQRQSFQ
jgi:hypothetical protein